MPAAPPRSSSVSLCSSRIWLTCARKAECALNVTRQWYGNVSSSLHWRRGLTNPRCPCFPAGFATRRRPPTAALAAAVRVIGNCRRCRATSSGSSPSSSTFAATKTRACATEARSAPAARIKFQTDDARPQPSITSHVHTASLRSLSLSTATHHATSS